LKLALGPEGFEEYGGQFQKMQRAFAAELLTPIDEVCELIGDDYTTERLEEVGDK